MFLFPLLNKHSYISIRWPTSLSPTNIFVDSWLQQSSSNIKKFTLYKNNIYLFQPVDTPSSFVTFVSFFNFTISRAYLVLKNNQMLASKCHSIFYITE